MMKRKRSVFFRITALLISLLMLCPLNANAAEVRASYYLDSYSAYVYAAGGGKVQICFSVTGVNYMDDIGCLSIELYESTDNSNWEWVDSYTDTNTSNLLAQNKIHYSSYVDYQGVAGRYYKAYVCIWAGKDGNGDSRYYWTSSTKAT